MTPLNVCLEDLTSADTRGRWWIVGSAWAGKNKEASTSKETTGMLNLVAGLNKTYDTVYFSKFTQSLIKFERNLLHFSI